MLSATQTSKELTLEQVVKALDQVDNIRNEDKFALIRLVTKNPEKRLEICRLVEVILQLYKEHEDLNRKVNEKYKEFNRKCDELKNLR